tara:strand:- start:234 stop:605 length:372 start_codon:yes stop_codon:yes gene_type:complete
MRAFILIVSIIISGSSFAQDFRQYDFAAVMTINECENYEEAIKKTNEFIAYEKTIQPNSQFVRCGMRSDGKMGCIILAESFETFEENQLFFEKDEEWNRLISLAWNKCGIEDYYYKVDTLTFE